MIFLDRNDLPASYNEAMSDARTRLSMASSLTAYQMYQCTFEASYDVPRACALHRGSENVVVFNPDKFLTWAPGERAFIVLHEIDHIFLDHLGRQEEFGYDFALWNTATDFYINLHGSGAYRDGDKIKYDDRFTRYLTRPDWVLYDEQFLGLSSDEIYHKLLKESNGDAKQAVAKADPNGGGSGEEGSAVVDQVSNGKAEEQLKFRNNRTNAAAIAKAQHDNSMGKGEGDMAKLITELATPVIDWRDRLPNAIESKIKQRQTFNRLSRRSDDPDLFFPSWTGRGIKLVFGVDTSASMPPESPSEALGELAGIMEEYEAWGVDVLTCDWGAHILGEFDSESHSIEDVMACEFIGGGGTDMTPIVDYATEKVHNGDELNICVVVTDGFIPTSVDSAMVEDDLEYLFIVTPGGNKSLTLDNAEVIFMDHVNPNR